LIPYHHEQVGRIYLVLGLTLAVPFAIGFVVKSTFLILFAIVFAVIYWAFARLNIDVDGEGGRPELRWSMTFGWPAGTIPLSDIVDAQTIPVTFWMGIGIHLTLRGWVWNVALGKGVQIRKRTGSDIILGTDDSEGLLAAIQRAR
jgi:hypothetical protein